jgi:uncharacterized membrane protein
MEGERMSEDGSYDIKPPDPAPEGERKAGPGMPLKPGDPGWVPPVPIIEKADESPEEMEAVVDPAELADIQKFKGMAVLAYICFLVPLVAAPNSKFARFHANQGLLVFILLIVITIVVAMLYLARFLASHFLESMTMLSSFFGCGFALLQFALLVSWAALVIMGIIHAANGERKELPVIGHWTLIK